jgi:hypothetical protein
MQDVLLFMGVIGCDSHRFFIRGVNRLERAGLERIWIFSANVNFIWVYSVGLVGGMPCFLSFGFKLK